MRDFMGLIHGAEDVYIENSYDYDKNKDYYDENNIRSNKDIFLINRKNDENYKKIGYVTYGVTKEENGEVKLKEKGNPVLKQEFYFIHLPTLIELMIKHKSYENKFYYKLTPQIINIGLERLGLMAKKRINCKTCDGKISMNLTKLYIDKLKELDLEGQYLEEAESQSDDIEEIEEEEIQNENDIEEEDYDFPYQEDEYRNYEYQYSYPQPINPLQQMIQQANEIIRQASQVQYIDIWQAQQQVNQIIEQGFPQPQQQLSQIPEQQPQEPQTKKQTTCPVRIINCPVRFII